MKKVNIPGGPHFDLNKTVDKAIKNPKGKTPLEVGRAVHKAVFRKPKQTLEEKLRARFENKNSNSPLKAKVEVEEGQGFRIIKDCFYQLELKFIAKVAGQHNKLYYISTFKESGRDQLFCNIFNRE